MNWEPVDYMAIRVLASASDPPVVNPLQPSRAVQGATYFVDRPMIILGLLLILVLAA
jgi:hypothetical protein